MWSRTTYSPIFDAADIRQVFCNGKKSWEMYHRYSEPLTGRAAICLPSTSPANAAWSYERLERPGQQNSRHICKSFL